LKTAAHFKKETTGLTDLEVIQKILNGEPALYEILIRRYNPFLYRIGRAYCYDHQHTEDLMQETYVSAYFNLQKFEHRSSFKTWLTKIMLHQCWHKKQKFSYQKETAFENNDLTEISIPMFQHRKSAEKELINKELGHVIENALIQIADDYRIVFTLRELNGLNVAETAGALNVSESNVKVRLNRAKAMLRNAIKKMYSPEDIFEFNLIYCDGMVERVMEQIGEKG